MFIRYIYIDKYESIIEKQDINFKWKYNFKYNEKDIELSLNQNYIDNFYDKYNNLDDLTAIIGKNTSGKSSILRAMNIIFTKIYAEISNLDSDNSMKFIAIFSKDNKLYCYHNMSSNVQFHKQCVVEEQIEICNIDKKGFIKDNRTKYVYYSGIFDKNTSLKEDENFIDISSNNFLRKSIEDTYALKLKRWRSLGKINESNLEIKYSTRMEIETEQFDFVDEFRKKEMLNQINYYSEIKRRELDKKNKPLFEFPQKIYISYADNFNMKDELKSDLVNTEEKNILNAFIELVEEYTLFFNGESYNMSSKEDNLIIQFALLIYYELVENLYRIQDVDVFWNIDEFLANINSTRINIDNVKEYINKLRYEKIMLEDRSIFEYVEKEDMEQKEILEDKLRGLISILEFSNEDKSNQLIEETIDEYKSKHTVKDKLNFILEKTEDILENVEYLTTNEIQLNDDKKRLLSSIDIPIHKLNDEYRRNISEVEEAINNIKDIIPREEKLGNSNYENLIYNELLYDEDEESEDLLQFYEELREQLAVIFEIMIRKNDEGYISENALKNIQYKPTYVESDDIEIIKSVDLSIKIISEWEKIIKSNKVTSYDYNVLALEATWDDSNILKFINLYNTLKINSFQIEYESEKMSSGQIVYFEMQHRIYSILSRFEDFDIILMIDEADIYMHPGVQIDFISNVLEFIKEFLEKNKVQIVITSNSPFIISDIPNSKIIYIDREENKNVNISEEETIANIKTLGAPINDLLINSFFMDEGIVGKFAQSKINDLIDKLYKKPKENIIDVSDEERMNLYMSIELIGDPLIRYKLISQYNSIIKQDKTLSRKQIELYKQMINELE